MTDAKKQSGTSPTSDFETNDQGSIILLTPLSVSARVWIDDHIGKDNGYQPHYPTVVIEHRYCAALIAQIERDGLVVTRG